jgi:hypothetical protein
MSKRAQGTFEVKLTPAAETGSELASARLTIEKSFQGDLVATSRAEMWTTDSGVQGSAAYVAIEKVTGTLGGRRGSFTMVHRGTMRRGGEFDMDVRIVPDSGTDELTGLAGRLEVVIEGAKHSYTLDYTLPDAP